MGGRSLAGGATADSATGMRERLALPRSASCPERVSLQEEPVEPGAAADGGTAVRRGSVVQSEVWGHAAPAAELLR
jgi:hypothetical protein